MHETAARLFQALLTIKGVDGLSEPGRAASFFGESAATITNWKARGVSKQGMLKANAMLGVNPSWLATGDGEMARWRQDPPPIQKMPVCQYCQVMQPEAKKP